MPYQWVCNEHWIRFFSHCNFSVNIHAPFKVITSVTLDFVSQNQGGDRSTLSMLEKFEFCSSVMPQVSLYAIHLMENPDYLHLSSMFSLQYPLEGTLTGKIILHIIVSI